MVSTYYEDFEKWISDLDTTTLRGVKIYIDEALVGSLDTQVIREVNYYLTLLSKARLRTALEVELLGRQSKAEGMRDAKAKYLMELVDKFLTKYQVAKALELKQLDCLDLIDYRGLGYCYRFLKLVQERSEPIGLNDLSYTSAVLQLNREFDLQDTDYLTVYQKLLIAFVKGGGSDKLAKMVYTKIEDKFKSDCLHYSNEPHFVGVYETYKLVRILETVRTHDLVEFLVSNVEYLEQLDAIDR